MKKEALRKQLSMEKQFADPDSIFLEICSRK